MVSEIDVLIFFNLKQEEAHPFLGLTQREGPQLQAWMKVSNQPPEVFVYLNVLLSQAM
jgi:hypothetical protein